MINERKLIEDFRKCYAGFGESMENSNNLITFKNVCRIINRQPKTDRWIPCSEKLPEKYCHCLVTRHNGYGDGFNTDVTEDTWIELEGIWDWESRHEGAAGNIIAWQPLPEPYQT